MKARVNPMVLAVILGVVIFNATAVLAADEGAQQQVTITAVVAQRIVFSITEGASIQLNVDPLENPEATGYTHFEVKTNAPSYSITASFGAFEVGNTGYDLIEHGNFYIMSTTSGTGMAIDDWTVPQRTMEVLSGEDGLTNGEAFTVGYMLHVDFTVPAGSATTTIVFTASVSM